MQRTEPSRRLDDVAALRERGKPVRVLGANVDITDKKNAERNLADRDAQLAFCIEHSPVPVAMFDREMRYLAASRRWWTDYRMERPMIGCVHYDVFPDFQ